MTVDTVTGYTFDIYMYIYIYIYIYIFFFSFLCMFLVNQWFLFRNFLLCCPSQRSARSHVLSQVATHQEIDRQLWAGGTPDSNPGLQDNSLVRYH